MSSLNNFENLLLSLKSVLVRRNRLDNFTLLINSKRDTISKKQKIILNILRSKRAHGYKETFLISCLNSSLNTLGVSTKTLKMLNVICLHCFVYRNQDIRQNTVVKKLRSMLTVTIAKLLAKLL